MRGAAIRSVLVLATLTVVLQARVDSTRWWQSRNAAASLHLSPAECRDLDRVYESTLPARRHLAERIVALADRVQQLNDNNAADDEVMSATERLASAEAQRSDLRLAFVAAVDRILSPEQRLAFHVLLAKRQISAD